MTLDNIGFDDIGFFPHSTIQVVPHGPPPPAVAPHIARNMTHVSVFPLLFPRATLGNGEGSIFTLPGTHLSWFILLMTVTFFPNIPAPIYATNICTPCFCPPHCPLPLAYLAQIATSSCHMLRLHHVPRPVLLTPVS